MGAGMGLKYRSWVFAVVLMAPAAAQDGTMPGSFGEALAHAFLGTPGTAQRAKQPDNEPQIQVASAGLGRNLSDEFYVSQAAAINKYSSWRSVPITFSTVSFQNGSYLVSWQETPDTFQAEHRERLKRADQGQGGWASWNALSRNSPYDNLWTITCLFPANSGNALSGVRSGAVVSGEVKIKSASGHQLVFDCRL